MASFSTGATRTADTGKFDYDGFLSPQVLERYARYMNKHRSTPDGGLRASDNWTLGIPRDNYRKSLWRHFMDLLFHAKGLPNKAVEQDYEETLCAVVFNTMGLLHEVLLGRDTGKNSGSDCIDGKH